MEQLSTPTILWIMHIVSLKNSQKIKKIEYNNLENGLMIPVTKTYDAKSQLLATQ